MQSCCFSFEQHLGRWAVFRQLFHHAERAPRMTSSLTAESPTIQKLQNTLGVDIRILATQIMCDRKTRKSSSALRISHFPSPVPSPSTTFSGSQNLSRIGLSIYFAAYGKR